MDVLGRFPAARNLKLAPTRRARTDEDRVEILREQRLHAVDTAAPDELDAQVEDIVALLVDHRVGQAELRDLRAHHAARLRVLIEHDAVISERREVAGDGERGRSAADERDPLAVAAGRGLGQARADVILEVGGDALEPADRDRVLLDASAPARRLARPIAGAPEDAGKYVGLPIDHVGVAVATSRDQSNVLRDGRVRRTSPLAVNHLVEVVRRGNVSRLHLLLVPAPMGCGLWRGQSVSDP